MKPQGRTAGLVRPLEPAWQEILDAVLSSSPPPRGTTGPSAGTRDVARLAPAVQELSRAYNAGEAEGKRTKLPLDARTAFSFPRDVPKGAAAIRELVGSGALTLPTDRALKVVDLGAGLGAMTWGLARALGAAGGRGRIEALLVDEDEVALARAAEIARAAARILGPDQPVDLAIATRALDLDAALSATAAGSPQRIGPADVVVLGQVLSELDRDALSTSSSGDAASRDAASGDAASPSPRVERHASLVRRILASLVVPGGSLVVVEPALRDRTRHLHAVRDRILALGPLDAAGGEALDVVAPCLHARSCPALRVETEWCHEDLPVDLPPWVVPLARAAGLRWQGLTFSYLVLRRPAPGEATAPRVPPSRGADPRYRFRVISDPIVSKGKSELFVCGDDGDRARLRRLDRDRGKEHGVSWDELRRGDVVALGPDPTTSPDARGGAQRDSVVDDRGRVRPNVHVAMNEGRAPRGD